MAQIVKKFLHSSCNAGDPGKGMAAHSNIIAWRIPWKEEPSGLQLMELNKSDSTERLTLSLSHRQINIREKVVPSGNQRLIFKFQ